MALDVTMMEKEAAVDATSEWRGRGSMTGKLPLVSVSGIHLGGQFQPVPKRHCAFSRLRAVRKVRSSEVS